MVISCQEELTTINWPSCWPACETRIP